MQDQPLTASSPMQSTSPDSAAQLRAHYANVVLPVWRGPGFNASLGLAYEAVAPADHAPLPPKRYRAMACARQLFVFSEAGDLAHAATLFESLRHYFQDRKNGGWFYSVDASGAPLERQKDLYTHAFVVFACAHYAKKSGSADALALLDETSRLVEARFSSGGDLLNAALAEDFGATLETPLQNPLMHLAEAWLAAREATGDPAYDKRLAQLARSVADAFVHQPSGAIAELPMGAPGNRLEPGHQFEWYFLAQGSGHAAFEAAGLNEKLARAFDFAQRHGVDAKTGGVCAALDEAGRVIDGTERIWAQTEYLRALATRGDPVGEQIERFRARFLHATGWVECRSAQGEITRAEMPSTTPYHLATSYAALPA
ncbi:N-acylglucosamine 2-epimerase [Burkholderia sp. SFA1]|uniref:AGE family epimerase/isomerase n=1 Tax=unclassified Caballeronia TaxID=2646786 RepID=UPI001F2E6AA5|nr:MULTISPECIES: AGE family epimerase/isomerase [unclassified Caballeronia]MCE4545306.1 AGE family epimerase/isomerase [Caballeronia sp. PC1]MCE4570732.1 AGE family epimerase/isomerase [Caballeronia sp. CLC5]BBP97817.1 N-acylglucosamine 2-epimerase [Burkholderia sp. SFA1]